MARSWVRLFAGATLTLSLTGHALADEGKITVFAAASLTNAMQDIAAVYKKEKTGCKQQAGRHRHQQQRLARLLNGGVRSMFLKKLQKLGAWETLSPSWLPQKMAWRAGAGERNEVPSGRLRPAAPVKA
ncbi:molybdate-binding periplasmic domain protein [Enterobacter hormaechei subsp. xiangfangensis]|nr:molybdate-binding periplasmic domain protein [Enterobacter hormaechei subsp. xiangfangensis]